MSTIGTNSEDLILNADGSGSDIKFKSNGTEVASISDGGVVTATSFTGAATDSTKLPLAGGTMTGNLLVESSASANTVVRSKGTAADGYRHGFEAVNGHTGGETWSMFSTNNSDSVFGGGKLVFSTGVAGSANASTSKLQITSDGRGLSQFTAKVWVHIDSGTLADGHNVSSITDNGTGEYQINFANNLANDNYSSTTSNPYRNGSGRRALVNTYNPNVNNINIAVFEYNTSWYAYDLDKCTMTIFGD